MCKVLGYPRSTYYDKQKAKPVSKWKSQNIKLREDILKIYNESNKIIPQNISGDLIMELKKFYFKHDKSFMINQGLLILDKGGENMENHFENYSIKKL